MNYKRLNEKMGDFFENVTGEELVAQLEELGYVLTENKEQVKKFDLADVVGQSEQLHCGDLIKHNFSLSKIGRCITCDRVKEKAR